MKPRHIVRQHLQRKQDRPERLPAVLGDGQGGLFVSGTPNTVYVQVAGGVTGQAWNSRVPASYGLPVWVGYDPLEPDRWQVLSLRAGAAEAAGFDLGGSGYAPADRYRWNYPGGGQDPLFVEGRQFLPLRLGPHTGLSVYVYPWVVWTGTGWAYVSGTAVDLTASVPATEGQARLVLVTIDESGAVVMTAGSEVALADLGLDDLPAVPAATRYVLGAVRLYYGQTVIQEGRSNTDVLDLRDLAGAYSGAESSVLADHDHSGDAGDGGAFPLANLSSGAATAGQVATANGAGAITWEDQTGTAGVGGGLIPFAPAGGTVAATTESRVTVVDDSLHNAFPGLTSLPDGTLLVVYRRATDHTSAKGEIYQRTSTDGGATWSAGALVYSDATYDVRDPNLTRLKNGDLILSFFKTNYSPNTRLLHGVYTAISHDTGTTWETPVQVTDSFTSYAVTSGPVVEMPNGTLALALYGLDSGGTYNYSRLAQSDDGGASWTDAGIIAQSASRKLDEPNLALLPNGELICLMRSDTPSNAAGHFYLSRSTDGGATWSEESDQFEATGAPHMLVASNGALLLTYRKNSDDSYTTAYRLSYDGGHTWQAEADLDSTAGIMTYAAATEYATGLIGVVYGIEASGDTTDSNLFFKRLYTTWEAGQLESKVATGTPPLVVASTTLVDNLNAEMVGGYTAAELLAASAHYELLVDDEGGLLLDDGYDVVYEG
jgi:hypothetical protein